MLLRIARAIHTLYRSFLRLSIAKIRSADLARQEGVSPSSSQPPFREGQGALIKLPAHGSPTTANREWLRPTYPFVVPSPGTWSRWEDLNPPTVCLQGSCSAIKSYSGLYLINHAHGAMKPVTLGLLIVRLQE